MDGRIWRRVVTTDELERTETWPDPLLGGSLVFRRQGSEHPVGGVVGGKESLQAEFLRGHVLRRQYAEPEIVAGAIRELVKRSRARTGR